MNCRLLGATALAITAFLNIGFGQGPTCDRACLEGFVDQYLDAMIAHDPGMIPTTLDVRMTENGQQLDVGDGLWRSIVGKGTYRLFVTDVDAGQVTFIGTIREEGNGEMERITSLALRLKVDKGNGLGQLNTSSTAAP